MNKIFTKNQNMNNWIVSVLVNAIVLVAVMLTTDMSYETNDDYVIAARIADGYPYVNFVNYYLCRLLIAVQGILPTVNVYVLVQIVFAYLAFVFITKLILDRLSELENAAYGKILAVLLVAVILIYSVDHYCTVQFTKTAAVLIVAAMLILIDSMTNKRPAGYYIVSIIMLYLGVSFRVDGLPVVIGFAGIYLIAWVVINRKRMLPEGYLKASRILLYVILLALIGACYGYDSMSSDANRSTPQLKEYKEFSEYRSLIVDYDVYSRFDENAEAYEAAGFDKNDLLLMDCWHFDYDGAASIDNMKKITDIDKSAKAEDKSIVKAAREFVGVTAGGVLGLTFTGVHIIILVLIALLALVSLKPRDWIYVVAIGAFAVLMHVFLFYMGRPAYRAIYIIDLAAAIWLIYFMAYRGDSARSASKPLGIVVILITLLTMVPVWNSCADRYDAGAARVMPQSLVDFAEENSDKLLVFSTPEKPATADYANPLMVPGSCGGGNIIGTGSWGSMSPYVLDKMGEYGIRNPIRDLIDSDDALYLGSNLTGPLTRYYNKWYGEEGAEIVLEPQESPEGYSVWKVVKRAK